MLYEVITDGVTLQGELNSVTVKELNLIPGALRVLANAKGNIVVKIKDLKF